MKGKKYLNNSIVWECDILIPCSEHWLCKMQLTLSPNLSSAHLICDCKSCDANPILDTCVVYTTARYPIPTWEFADLTDEPSSIWKVRQCDTCVNYNLQWDFKLWPLKVRNLYSQKCEGNNRLWYINFLKCKAQVYALKSHCRHRFR